MKNRLIITESQLSRLKIALNEATIQSTLVKSMKTELDRNYEPILKYVRKGGEYFEKPMIRIKADDEAITGKEAMDYLKFKLKYTDNLDPLIKQTIIDWVDDEITDDYRLSKNITIT